MKPGDSLGPYRVVSELGVGGMGEVYRAHDAKLNRDVAIKILPDVFAHDTERVARFTREAQTLASLNHPNIAQIYGVIEEDQPAHVHALVMELVEGDDLSVLIARGPMPLTEALPIAKQIAEALEAAHEQGIVHRDLKPANVKVRADGTVKVLDFGLAKAAAPDGAAASADAMNSPTLTARGTQVGLILGTAAYMAPEQARGKAVDRRADIWAFGVVLYEMLTGRRAFDGEETSDILAAVLRQDVDWTALPADTPAGVRRVLRRCLERDPRKRLGAIGDARFDLDETEPVRPEPSAQRSAPHTRAAAPSLVARLWPALAGAALTAAIAALVWPSPARQPAPILARLGILAPPGASFYPDTNGVAISPDGTMVAFIVGDAGRADGQLWVRSLDSMTSRRIEGGDGAANLFWSPDSRRIGFTTTQGKLKTIAASGGPADVLADAPNARGAAWTASNLIIFAPDASGPLYKIPATGGTPVAVTKVDAARREYGHRFPTLLPDGEHFLYASLPSRNGQFDIYAGSLNDNSRVLVGSMAASPVYAEPGWLLYARQGVLVAQPFDAKSLKTTGDPVLLDDEPSCIMEPRDSWTAGRSVSISSTGSLAYYSAPSPNTTVEWYDTTGRTLGTVDVPAGHYDTVAVSPDGTHAAMVRSMSPSESTIWLVDLVRGGALPLSSGRGRNDRPVWSPDGRQVAFAGDRDGAQNLFVKTVGDSVPEQLVFSSDVIFKSPEAWSPDGRWLIVGQLDPATAQNAYALPVPGGAALKPLVTGPDRDFPGPVSPDGRWLAYFSNETGRFELYVQSFPDGGNKLQVSQAGARAAWWTRDGRQLLFVGVDSRSLWRADVTLAPASGGRLTIGAPTKTASFPSEIRSIDATPDRQRLLALSPERTGAGSITVVQNWHAALVKGR